MLFNAVICSTSCGSIQSVPAPFGGCGIETRKWGFTKFILFKCDYEFTDILDASEWETAIAAGNINVSPPGIIDFPTPTLNSVEVTGCGLKVPLPTLFQATYTSRDTDPDNLLDFAYYENLEANVQDYRIGFLDCEDNFYLESNWVDAASDGAPATVSDESPGFEFSLIQIPHFTNDGNGLFQWNAQFEIKKAGILKAIKLPGVPAKLK